MPNANSLLTVIRTLCYRCMRGYSLRATMMMFFASAALPSTTIAQPANDSCTTPTVIGSLPYNINADVSTATAAPTDPTPSCGPFTYRTTWYSFTAPRDLLVRVSTANAGFAVYSGSCGALSQVACGWNVIFGSFSASSGQTYLIEIGQEANPPSGLTFSLGVWGCGNGILEPAEDCDDGNLSAGDGCDPTCHVEECWSCSGAPSHCTPLADTTACDNGNLCTPGGCQAGTCVVTPLDPCTI